MKTTALLMSSCMIAAAMHARTAAAQTRWPGSPGPGPGAVSPMVASAPSDTGPEETKSPRPTIFFVDTEGGYQSVSLHMLAAENFIPHAVDNSAGGAFFGLGAGARWQFLSLGARYRTGDVGNWNLHSVNGELRAHIALGRVEPYFSFGAGYAAMSTSESTWTGQPSIGIHGFNGRAGLGVNYYPDKILTMGLNLTGDVLAMARPGVDLTTSAQSQVEQIAARCNALPDLAAKQQCAMNAARQAEGSSVGVGAALSFVMGLHF